MILGQKESSRHSCDCHEYFQGNEKGTDTNGTKIRPFMDDFLWFPAKDAKG